MNGGRSEREPAIRDNTMITPEKLASTKAAIDKLIAHGKALFEDITETTNDRARLLKEAEDREKTIERLNQENAELEQRNNRMAEDAIKLESELTDASARLEAIYETINTRPPSNPARNGGSSHSSMRATVHELR